LILKFNFNQVLKLIIKNQKFFLSDCEILEMWWSFLELTSFFLITTLQAIKEKLFKLTASLWFHVYLYPCCLKAWYKSKLNSKIVFIELIYTTTTVPKRPACPKSMSKKYVQKVCPKSMSKKYVQHDWFHEFDWFQIEKNPSSFHLVFLGENCHLIIHTYIHTYIHLYIHKYIHTYSYALFKLYIIFDYTASLPHI